MIHLQLGDVMIVCDDASHPQPQTIITFGGDGSLHGNVRMIARVVSLWDDKTAGQVYAADPQREAEAPIFAEAPDFAVPRPDVQRELAGIIRQTQSIPGSRTVFNLTCRRCKSRPVAVRAGKLQQAVDAVRRADRTYVTLAELAAILKMLPASPEAEPR